ncbi:MAG: DNA repair protein RecN (Recombination protein N) [Nitriliruptoraceae bacterium]|jgi:DNA repair protein RecN (Recombination protein N)
MIDELQIRSLGVIEEATLELSPGLTVVTGETGAGKTMVVTALQLLLGARAPTGLVRHGAAGAWVAARFVPVPESAREWTDEDELVVERELRTEGRSRARIGGRLAPVGALADAVGPHVEVHGQGEHARLARPREQRALLDRFAGDAHHAALQAHRAAHAALLEARDRRTGLHDDARERQRTIDRLRHELAEIESVAPDADADAGLGGRLAVLEHAEELAAAAHRAAEAIGSDGAGEALGEALDALRRLPAADPVLDAAHERIVAVVEEARDIAGTLRGYVHDLDADPEELELLRARQRELQELFRRYGVDVTAVLDHGASAAKQLMELEDADADADALDQRVIELGAAAVASAAHVTQGRRAAARRLEAAVDGLLGELGMPHATFLVELASSELSSHGGEQIAFLLAANPGEPPASLERAASGGERSRVALAIEVALADAEGASVLVFDEVDAGIGGATAMAVGEQLARLARTGAGRQVLCVTHLAQLAAFADVHHVVTKQVVGERTVTTVRRIADDARAAELSRMLGGDAGGDAGLAHAAAMLEEAARRAG